MWSFGNGRAETITEHLVIRTGKRKYLLSLHGGGQRYIITKWHRPRECSDNEYDFQPVLLS